MIDVFLLIVVIILSVLLVVTSIYLLAHYCHPDDKGFGSGLICKIVVVAGLTLSWAQVLMLPLDVANVRGLGGEIRMDVMWQIVYVSIGVFIIFVIPICSYFYESDPDWSLVYIYINSFSGKN